MRARRRTTWASTSRAPSACRSTTSTRTSTQLPRDAWLVCYCACPHAESGNLARKLVEKGFTKVTVLDEGLGVWRNRKYPTSSGIDP